VSAQSNQELIAEFRRRQGAMYAGGELEPVAELLTDDIVWHVPGRSPIAGDHRGRGAVLRYFTHRRALAENTMRIEIVQSMADEQAVAELADGRARLGGEEAFWRTIGLYRIQDGRIAEAWLVPFDLAAFDRAWSRTRRHAHVHEARIRAQECNDGAVLGHPRLLEHLEAAFFEAWRAHAGSPAESLGSERRLTVVAIDVQYRAPVRFDDVLQIEVAFDRVGESSLQVHYAAWVGDVLAADGRVTYVCLHAQTGRPVELPPARPRSNTDTP
jgi:acyl-CoA thioesterase FadM/predicted SnoaL-like aldol condensation-catalyzing enzyme